MARRWTGLAAIATVLAVTAPAHAATSKRPCRIPTSSTVLATSSFATLYSVRKGAETIYRACLRRDGTRVELRSTGDEPDDIEVANMMLAGRYAGWTEVRRTRYQDSSAGARVYDLKRLKVRSAGVGPYRPAGDAPRVTDFALAKTGRAAFVTQEYRIDYPEDGRPGEWRTVWALDAAGTRALEEGPRDIHLTSLDLKGFIATWTSGGQRRSAQLY